MINKDKNIKQFEISYAKKQDAAAIISLVHHVTDFSLTKIYAPSAVEWLYNYHSLKHLEEEFGGGAIVAVIYDEKKLIGTATYFNHEIKRVFIHPEYQKMGLGKLFMKTLEERARKKNEEHIMLYANPATWRYYESMGFKKINMAAARMKDGQYLPYCTMVKNLVSPDWQIEKAQKKEAVEILRGQKKAFEEVAKQHEHMDMPPMTETKEAAEKALMNATVFIAKTKKEIVGSVRGEEKDGACYISRLWVLPEYQKKGIGHALMFAVEDAFVYLDKYELFTGSKSEDTIEFYKERGYEETKREPLRNYELVYLDKMNAMELLN